MPKIVVSGKGGSGKSTLVTLMAKELINKGGQVLIVDADESNLSLSKMLGVEAPKMSLMNYLGGKGEVGKKLMESLKSNKNEFISLFDTNVDFSNLPSDYCNWTDNMGLMYIGKIEHSMEGCACPMGAVARSFLKELTVEDNQWTLVDTEAGVEHFGRGVIEGADLVLMLVDTSYESILLAEKGEKLAKEAKRPFKVVLNKVNDESEKILREELGKRNIDIAGSLIYSDDITRTNLLGKSSQLGNLKNNIDNILSNI